jgi:hypothetical protein
MRGAVRLLLLSLALVWSCSGPTFEPTADAGDEAWVQQTLPLVLGRRAESAHELAALVQLVEQTSRADAVRAMATTDDFRQRWEFWLLDALVINRLGTRKNESCYGITTPGSASESGDLAAFVRDHGPEDGAFEQPHWTMLDLIRSTLHLGDLSPLYRAQLFAAMALPQEMPNQAEAIAVRQDLANVFLRSYLHRDFECIACHNSEWSVTDAPSPELDRTWQVPGLFELALFGSSEGRPPEDLHALFRKHGITRGFLFAEETRGIDGCFPTGLPGCDGCGCEERVCDVMSSCCTDEWTAECAALCRDDEGQDLDPGQNPNCIQALPEGFDGCTPLMGHPGCGGCACEEQVCAENPLCCERGWSQACSDACRYLGFCEDQGNGGQTDHGGLSPWGFDFSCGQFEAPDDVGGDPLGQTAWFIEDLGEGGSVWDLEAYFREGTERLRDGLEVDSDNGVHPAEALAWLWVANVADQVWAEAMGERLTISNYFPRNQAQRDRLVSLSEAFLESGYSLPELLVAVTTDPAFNLVDPRSVLANESPYALDGFVNPWAIDKEAEPERQANSVGDQVHRWPPRLLVNSLHRAMGWPTYPAFPLGEPDNEYRVQEDLGFFLKDSLQGFQGADLQALAAWEQIYGRCERLGEADWIDELVAEADGATLGDAVATLKDRLLGDPRIDADEQALLEAVMERSFDDDVSEPGLRWACGLFAATPQFHLRGPVPGDVLDDDARPPVRIGPDDAGWCERWAERFDDPPSCE